MHRKRWLLPAALVCATALSGVLAWMIAERAAVLRDGTEIVLKTEPFDPVDLLRGRYVRLNYSISRLPVSLFDLAAGEEMERGTPIFVRLEENGDGYWQASGVSRSVPADAGGIWIEGRISYDVGPPTDSAGVDYGIERFYVPEPIAPEIEARMRDGMVTDVVVAVGEGGMAQIKALRQGDRTIFTERLF